MDFVMTGKTTSGEHSTEKFRMVRPLIFPNSDLPKSISRPLRWKKECPIFRFFDGNFRVSCVFSYCRGSKGRWGRGQGQQDRDPRDPACKPEGPAAPGLAPAPLPPGMTPQPPRVQQGSKRGPIEGKTGKTENTAQKKDFAPYGN